MSRILIIEDDPGITELLVSDLELEKYTVQTTRDGLSGVELAKSFKPDLIILDLTLPKMNGYDVCRTLRKDGSNVPILMLTARTQEAEKVVGLDVGADDYITKPYSSMELMARVRAFLRRHKNSREKAEKATFGDITIDFESMVVTKSGKIIEFTKKEFQMLELLVRNHGKVISRDQFLEQIWKYSLDDRPSTRTVDTHVTILRRKLSPENPEAYIVSVHGTGYKFIA
jgi:two-component system alkaline phosphatase synthesis response regulator PhoP